MNPKKVLFCGWKYFIIITLSLSDYSTGFGGKFGVQKDRVDKSSVGWDHHEKVEKHESQKGTRKIIV